MLEADVREQHDGRVEHIGGVEPAPEPCLDSRDLDTPLGEVEERRGGENLELRGADGERVPAHAPDRALEARGVGVETLVPARDVR